MRGKSHGYLSLSLITIILALHLAPVKACVPSEFIVAVDIGHSLQRSGAVSARGVPELKFNQALGTAVIDALLATGFSNSVIINADGRIGSLKERVRKAKQAQANLFLSIHHDSVQPSYLSRWTVNGESQRYSDHFRGFSLFISNKNKRFEDSQRFAMLLGKALTARGMTPTLHHAESIPGENRPLLNPTLGVYRYDNLYVLKHTSMPALLLEAGVIVHRDEELQLSHPAHQQRLAAGISAAVYTFCGELK